MLETRVGATPDDPFPRYGLALEYKRLGRSDEAVEAFVALGQRHPDYVPQYLMFGNLLEALGRAEEAIEVYGRGIDVADKAGDEHAGSELEAARDALQ